MPGSTRLVPAAGPPPDPVVVGAVAALGGPDGRHARPPGARRWTPVRWLVLLALVTCGLGFWQKAPCRVHEWQDEYQYTRACYTDVLALWYAERLDEGARPYLDEPVEYPVLIGAAMALAASGADQLAAVLPGQRVVRAQDRLAAATDGGDAAAVQAARADLERAQGNAVAHSFQDLTWVLLSACALVVVVTTARLAGRQRVWDAAMVAVAPALVVHLLTNWDLLAVALAGLGLLAWARSRPVAAGALLGLATATKLYPVLFAVPLLALCLRAGRLRAGLSCVLALVATAAAVTLPVYLSSPAFAPVDGRQVAVAAAPLDRFGDEGLAALAPHTTVLRDGTAVTGVNGVYRFVELNQTRPADWDSLAYAVRTLRDNSREPLRGVLDPVVRLVLGPDASSTGRLNAVTALGALLVLALVVLLALRAPRRPRLPQLLFLTVAGFLLTNKVHSPQYVLWLLPLAVLARPRWRPFLAWQAAEVAVLLSRFLFFVSMPMGEGDQANEGIDVLWFVGAVLVRDVALLLLCAAVVRDVLRPEADVVRAGGEDDPAGGPLDRAPDARALTPA